MALPRPSSLGIALPLPSYLWGLPSYLWGLPSYLWGLPSYLWGLPSYLWGLPSFLWGLPFFLWGLPSFLWGLPSFLWGLPSPALLPVELPSPALPSCALLPGGALPSPPSCGDCPPPPSWGIALLSVSCPPNPPTCGDCPPPWGIALPRPSSSPGDGPPPRGMALLPGGWPSSPGDGPPPRGDGPPPALLPGGWPSPPSRGMALPRPSYLWGLPSPSPPPWGLPSPCPPTCGDCPPTCGDCPPSCGDCPPSCGDCPPSCGDCPPSCGDCPPSCGDCPPSCGDCPPPALLPVGIALPQPSFLWGLPSPSPPSCGDCPPPALLPGGIALLPGGIALPQPSFLWGLPSPSPPSCGDCPPPALLPVGIALLPVGIALPQPSFLGGLPSPSPPSWGDCPPFCEDCPPPTLLPVVADQIPMLVQGVRGSQTQPDSPSAQLSLISASQNFLQPGHRLVSAGKAAVPTVSDPASAMQLGQCTKNLASALAELRTAAQKAQDACGPLEIDSALNLIRSLEQDLQEAKAAAREGKLKPLPGETLEKCSQDLGSSTKAVSSSIAQLLGEIVHGNENYTGRAARDVAHALRSLAQASRGVAANSADPSVQNAMLECAGDVMDKAGNLIEEAKKAVGKPADAEGQQRLAQVAKAVSQALSRCVNCLPGQRDVDAAIKSIGEASKKLLAQSFSPNTKNFQEAQSQLNQAAAGLSQSANELVQASRGTPQDLAKASGKYSQDFSNFLQAGVEMAGQSQSKEDQAQVVSNLKSISLSSSKLLLAVKALSADPAAPNLKSQLAAAARAVTDSINQLITVCTQQAPGQKECDNALRELETVRELLQNPTEAVNDQSYFHCLDSVMENSKVLGESMAGISQNAKTSNLPEFGESVSAASKALCGLTEAAAQAAYLVGVSDPNSRAGQQGLVDPTQFARANQAIQMACQNLGDPACTQSQVLSAATIVAKHTSALCNACRLASTHTSNPVAKRQFVQSAKEVANSTANLVKTIKALDGAFNDENRIICRDATVPLIQAVENLTAFASNPEFASVPAQISSEGLRAMEPILSSAKTMLESSSGLIQTARSLAANPKDPPQWSVLAGHSRTVSDSIKKLITNMRDKAPGQRECDQAIELLNQTVRELDQASLEAISQQLAPREGISQEALHTQMQTSVQEISNLIEPVAAAARADSSQLGHKVSQMAQYFEPLTHAAIGAASKTINHQQQMNLLDQTKTLAESALQMLYTAKEAGGNPKVAAHTQEALDEAAQMMHEAVDDLTGTLNEAASAAGAVGGMVDSITQAINKLDEEPAGEPEGSFVDYQTTMVKTAKAIAVTVQEMVTKSTTNPDELGTLANQLTSDYGQLAHEAKPAAMTAENEEIGSHIKQRVQELGHGCSQLVTNAGALQCSPNDSYTKKELMESARRVSEKVSHVLAALQAGNRGTQACITAASAVSGIIADLDTTIMFATAGTLNRENAETFADHREGILKTAKALVEDTKVLVQNATSSQEKLAQAAQSSVTTITRLAETVKLGAASLGADDPETQVVLINAVKDVAKALGDLISATKAAAGKSSDDPSVYQLKNSAKVMVTNVTSLLKTVKAVEDEATKGTRALEATIEHIRQELVVFSAPEPPPKTSTPEEFIRMTKGITMATAKAVAAGNSCRQEDVIATANLSRRAIADMLHSCKEAAYHPEVSPDVRLRAMRFGKECATGYLLLLEHVLVILQKPNMDLKQQLTAYSKQVAGSVTELIQAAEAMKGTEWVDPEDPTVIAENELLGAAAAIEAAAKKLEQLKPRAKPKQADESLNFEEQILEAAKSIAAATSALVKAASAAQRELVAQGKVGAIPANAVDDGQWSQGLISAARMVAAATSNLCEAANSAVQGHASEEKLISSAKQVAASTAQLLVACKVKADHDSEAMKRLQVAGNAVKRASDNLVKAAQKAAAFQDHDETVVVKEKMVGGIAQIIAAQEEMLRKERELEEARKKLAMIRQQQYKFLPSELREDGHN
ncbi:talin-1 isoform X2 [Pelobates cultripes]|uniref:Talin-1 isoform X2 n=1 Tax=Pelobates cultripes TaxID=61616 RepID=A0AAD1SE31_PELCU|nr:talin-1 isoform X2 [Pelobates cultripes]